jgi:hypothetical protein
VPSIIEYVLKERGAWPAVPPQLSQAQQRMMPYPVMNVLDLIGSEERLEDVWEKPGPVPDRTYHDLLAHIATGDWVCQGILRTVLEGGDLEVFVRNLDLDGTNARLVVERRDASISSLAYEYVSMRWETFALMSRLTPEQIAESEIPWRYRNPPVPGWDRQTLQEYLDGFWRHDALHLKQLETALALEATPGEGN